MATERYVEFSALTQLELREPMVVSDDTFFDYLHPDSPLAKIQGFAPTLDLCILTPAIQEIYEFPPSDIAQEAGDFDTHTWLDKEIPVMVGSTTHQRLVSTPEPPQANDASLVEKGRIVFRGPSNPEVQFSEIVEGEPPAPRMHATVDPGAEAVKAEGNIPLIAIHEHRKPVMPNDFDYLYVALRDIRGSMVLCPDIQILTVATEDTPTFENEGEVIKFLDEWEEKFNTEIPEAVAVLKEEARKIAEQGKIQWLRQQIELGNESGEVYNPDTNPEYVKVKESLRSCEPKEFNRIHMEIARAMGVAIYTSTNMRNFSLATA